MGSRKLKERKLRQTFIFLKRIVRAQREGVLFNAYTYRSLLTNLFREFVGALEEDDNKIYMPIEVLEDNPPPSSLPHPRPWPCPQRTGSRSAAVR